MAQATTRCAHPFVSFLVKLTSLMTMLTISVFEIGRAPTATCAGAPFSRQIKIVRHGCSQK